MSFIDLTPKDVMRGVLIDPPGWYTVLIQAIGEPAPSKDGESMNTNIDAVIVKNADSGDEKFKDFPVPNWFFNSKAPGFATGFLRACGVEPEVGRNSLKVGEGKTIDIYIKHQEYNGRMSAKPSHEYRPTR